MFRRALLFALVVCSVGVLVAGVHPAAAGPLSESMDGPDDHDDHDDDRWYDGWGSDGDETAGDDDETDDRSDDGEFGNDRDGGDGDASNGTEDATARGDENTSRDAEGEPTGDDDQNGSERQSERYQENGSHDGPGTTDGGHDDRDENETRSLAERVLDLTNGTARAVTDGVTGDLDGDGDADVALVDVDDGAVRVGGLGGESSDGTPDDADRSDELVALQLDDDLLDDRGRLRAGSVTVGGVLVVPLAPPEILAMDGRDDGPVGRPGPPDASPANAAMVEPLLSDEPASVVVAGSDTSEPEGTDEIDGEAGPATGAGDDGEGGAGGAPGSGAGAGAALVVTVGLLGGTRTALDGTTMIASQGPGSTLATLRHAVAGYLDELPGGTLPALVGYSRHDSSDPLENDTRAQIYDVVQESPGTYHAQLAEETGVAVETVRYHSRILAEEGLVEARKIRGRRRLFPVTMDDDDPELAAAIADSAASDVLSVIERREPTTLSAIAEAVDCAPSTVSYHVDRLEDDGLVSRERDGGAVRVRLRRSTRSALQGQVADD